MKTKPIQPSDISLPERYGLPELDASALSTLCFRRGEYLCQAGKRMDYLMLVTGGRVKVCRESENGKRLLLTFYSGEGLLGDLELMLGMDDATSDVQAVTDVTAVGVPWRMARTLTACPSFVLTVARGFARDIDRNTQNSVVTVLNSVMERLCGYILMVAVNGVFQENLSVLAELLGTSYRHLLRSLATLCEQRVLVKTGRAYVIADEGALRRLGGDWYRL